MENSDHQEKIIWKLWGVKKWILNRTGCVKAPQRRQLGMQRNRMRLVWLEWGRRWVRWSRRRSAGSRPVHLWGSQGARSTLCALCAVCLSATGIQSRNSNAAKSPQSCMTLCDPIQGSPLGSSVPGIFQARTLEWVAISFSNARKWKVKVKSLSHAQLLVTPWTAAYQAPPSMGFSRREYWSRVPLPSLRNSYSNRKWKLLFSCLDKTESSWRCHNLCINARK